MTKTIYTILLSLALALPSSAAIHIKVNAPRNVAMGEDFRIEYYVSTNDVSGFTGPKFPPQINVLYGPSRSEMSSYQVINGKSSGSSSVTFTYTCTIDKACTVTIPSATITVGGTAYHTGSVTIRATGSPARTPQGGSGGGSQAAVTPSSSGGRISPKDLFITVSANKTNVHEQEPVVLTYKIYARVNLTQMTGKMPDLKGFLIQEVPLPRQKSFHVEPYKGENYQTTTWCQYVMFPQQSGKLVIPSIKFDGIVAVANPNIDPFDAFFNGNPDFAEVKKSIMAPSITINVSKLPTPKPADYSGAVGRFNVSSQILTPKPRTNENLSIRFTVNGVGNMKLITAPKLNLGSDFDVFPAKLTDHTKLTSEGISGTMIYDYVVVPRQKGDYTLPAIKLGYFNTTTGAYSTAATQPINFRVEQGAKSVSEDEELLRRDINDIHRGLPSEPSAFLSPHNPLYYACFAILAALFAAACLIIRRSERFRSNITLRQRRGAKRTAERHLKQAHKLMTAGNVAAFYDETARALLTYASHRLSIPMSEFTTDELRPELMKRGASEAEASEFVDIMKQCEFARYAPGDPQENMSRIYERASSAIAAIENSIK